MSTQPRVDRSILLFILAMVVLIPTASAQNAAHPDAKSPLPENPYIKHQDPWRWDIRSQVFLRAGVYYYNERSTVRDVSTDRVESVWWAMKDIEVIYPVVREGGFYWSPNKAITASIRAGDFERETTQKRMFTKNTKAEYTLWRSDVQEYVHQIHIIHNSKIVVSDTVFDHVKARQLPWPDPEDWSDQAKSFLSPIVDSVGYEVASDADETIKTLLDFWVENNDPQSIPQLDLVKFLTGKVIEHVQVRNPPAEISTRSGNRILGATFVAGTSWSGFVVRSGDLVARDPYGTKHDLATLLTSILRSAGVPARTLLCVNMLEEDTLERMVSMVEFAMYDPERDLTFWVPIDVDRLRLNGKRASQYQQWWNYLGTHDELNDYVPVAYYFHPPASYKAFDLPALYGMRSSSPLPEYVIQSIIIDPMVSPATGGKPAPHEATP